MNSLEGYNTNGHEYRVSQMDRSNSRRIKWMMDDAREKVKKRDEDNSKNNNVSNTAIFGDKNIRPTLHNKSSNNSSTNNTFNPSTFNKFSNFKNKINND